MATASALDRFRSPSASSRHRKGRSSSECIRKSDGITLSDRRSPAVRIFIMNDGIDEEEAPAPQKTPRDQIEEEPSEESPGSLGRAWRRKSVNIGSPLPGPQTQSKSFYDFVGVIGEGKTSQVYFGVHKKTGEKVAIKVIDRRRIVANPDLIAEVGVLKKLSHPNIISLKDVFITPDNLQIVMELCQGHELFDEIVDRRTFNEVDARDLIRQILEPLAYLHKQGIAHRDLKPENIMFVNEDDTKNIKLLDFGFAKVIDVAHPEVSMVGTLGYKAPEVFNSEPYTTQCDMWALGVMAYILLCGFPPFFSQEHYKDMVNNAPFWFFFNDETDTLIDQIKRGKVAYPDSHWSKLSKEAKSFVQSLLVVDPKVRATAEASLNHAWMTWKPSPFHRADLAIKNMPAALERLRHGGRHTRQISGIYSFSALDAVRNTVERHILGDPTTRALSISADWERTDVDDSEETLIDVKYRMLASYDTQEAQLEMLSAIDQPTLRTYLHQRKGSFGSRTSLPSKTKHWRKASF